MILERSMQLSPYLSFNGQCEQAFKFYEKCLRGRITMMMKYGESPLGEQTDPAWRNKILHATLAFGDQRLSGADPEPQHYRKPQGLSVLLSLSDAAEAKRIFATLAENG